jgi:hypothetical protein
MIELEAVLLLCVGATVVDCREVPVSRCGIEWSNAGNIVRGRRVFLDYFCLFDMFLCSFLGELACEADWKFAIPKF